MKVVFAMSFDSRHLEHTGSMIPGGYERNTLTHRQRGSMGADPRVALPVAVGSMDAATVAEREREGGGAPSQRRHKVKMQAQTRIGPALRGTEPRGFWLTGGFLWIQILRLARR
jgi:hypothetical protein